MCCINKITIFISANRRTAFDFEPNGLEGVPDGMTIDTEGKLWVATFGGSQVSQKCSKKLYIHSNYANFGTDCNIHYTKFTIQYPGILFANYNFYA
jgi:secreted PhoX family phosphatase